MLKKVPTHFHLHAVLEYLEIQFPELVDVKTGDMAHTYRFDLFGPGPRMSVIYPLSANIADDVTWIHSTFATMDTLLFIASLRFTFLFAVNVAL
uniref:Uncharacterized protein n=1 Tax=Onchocerca volvulus TaxID=6282 RepID=A0A8R1XK12_ONCVO